MSGPANRLPAWPAAGLRGHAWTVLPRLGALLRPGGAPAALEWAVSVDDERWGAVRLSGALSARDGERRLAVLVHGLGGGPGSYYVGAAARAFAARGTATLAVALRGADHRGEDVYHAGLGSDLGAVLASPDLRRFEELHLVGFSVGGHLALRWAAAPTDPRVRTVTAVCAPLHLGAAQERADSPRAALYRHYVLGGLKAGYAMVARRRALPTPLRAVRRCRTFREWDELVVVPRFGFRSADHYYESQSVAPQLAHLRVPALLVHADRDPIVPLSVVAPFVPAERPDLCVRRTARGGHLGFPRDLDLGFGPERGLYGQLLAFWRRHAR